MPDFKIIAKVTNRLVYDPHAEEVFRTFVFRSLNEDIYKYKEIDFDRSGDTGSATIVFEQGVIQNDEEFMVCVTAFDDEGSMESWCKIATNHPEPQPEEVTFDVSSNQGKAPHTG
jgi:hypothetical protein